MSTVTSRAIVLLSMLAVAAAVAVFSAVAAPTALAAEALLPTQTLFDTERVTPAGTGVAARTGGALPENLLALRGEFEAFQLAIQNTGAAPIELDGRLTGLPGGAISAEILRVGMVDVPVGSTSYKTAGGTYADPLPPLRGGVAGGRLTIPAGQWGGVLVLVRVRTDAPTGDFAGTLELFTGSAGQETYVARQAFTLSVRNATLKQSGEPGAFTSTFGVEADQYWLGHKGMRNGQAKDPDFPARPQRMLQLAGLMSFFDEKGFTPLEMPFATPNAAGSYSGCAYDSTKGEQPAFSFIDQLKGRYFGTARAIQPGANQLVTRWIPYRTVGCPANHQDDTSAVGMPAVLDKKHTPSLKQDDVLHPAAPAYWQALNGQWVANGLYNNRTYVKSPFDEPSDATPAQRVQMNVELPKATIAQHKAFGSRAKVVLAGWPRDERKKSVCLPKKQGQKKPTCIKYELDTFGNRKLWDKKGADDIDVWMVPVSRMYGRVTQPHFKKLKLKVNRDREYTDRLAAIRTAKKTNETWFYNFYTADRNTFQTVIDAPGTDARLQYLLAAREGHTGMFISNMLMGWGSDDAPKLHDGTSLRKNGNPYTQAPYFKHATYGYAAGWGTFIYPPYAPELGLRTEDDRNSASGRPVSSLRIEGMRDGQEDANLAIMYRARFGQAKLNAQLAALFPNKPARPQVRSLGQVVFPYYDNTNMAQRMETVRRAMILGLAG